MEVTENGEKTKLGAVISGAEKNAKTILNKSKDLAIRVVDQNDDGKFDLADVSEMAGSVGDAVKRGTQAVVESAEEKRRQHEMDVLRPVFVETLEDTEFFMPKFIRITERDKKRAESEVCKGSLGFYSTAKDLTIMNIFNDSVEDFGLNFFPDAYSEFYYVDPCDRDKYIALDEYFGYLKHARVSELQKIAQDLGATHFRVTLEEEQVAFTEKRVEAKTKAKKTKKQDAEIGCDAEGAVEGARRSFQKITVEAESDFPGQSPVMPRLKYLQKEPAIQNLVSMRMNQTSPASHVRFSIKMSQTSGIKENVAMKIDAALKDMKFIGNATVTGEAQNESRRYLEYEIDF